MFRKLKATDYHKGYLELLSQLTKCDKDTITYEAFTKKLELIESSGIYIVVIELKDRIIATGTLVLEHKFIHGLSAVGHIEDIVVDSSYRGQGFGVKIIEHLVAKSKEQLCYKVILDCSNDNIGFYEKCGFIVKGVQMSMYHE